MLSCGRLRGVENLGKTVKSVNRGSEMAPLKGGKDV
jgi:hypothetical protein